MVMLAAGSGRDSIRSAFKVRLHSQLLVCKVNGTVFILNSDILLKLEEFAPHWGFVS